MSYRQLSEQEITFLKNNNCRADNWSDILVADAFKPDYVSNAEFHGKVKLGVFEKDFSLAGGIRKHSGIRNAVFNNVEIGDNTLVENVSNYIANYVIGHDTFIENAHILITDLEVSFGNGVEVSVLNETGGREVPIYNNLSAQIAYIIAMYRHRPKMIQNLKCAIGKYVKENTSTIGHIGSHCRLVDVDYIKNVNIGDWCKVEGTSRLYNGTIISKEEAPVIIGSGVVADNFIIQSGSSVKDGVTLRNCFVGQACELGRTYSASDSLFFANCFGENGEACALFAGPYTVTHHKSTLLIAGLFSFMNAGSGSNQSNHMYKLGPLHQGIMERGSKTASDSYLLWPAKVGAFSLVMGRHTSHQNTSNLPFSYLIEDQGTTYIVPGANLKSVGTIRDVKKWPKRDERKDMVKLDCINYNLLSPYTIQKMLNGIDLLQGLQKVSGYTSDIYSFQSCKIRNSSLKKGITYYRLAIDKFLGNSLVTRIMQSEAKDIDSLRKAFLPTSELGSGDWVDAAGLIAPKNGVTAILDEIENGTLCDVDAINARFHALHDNYYDSEWTWAYDVINRYYNVNLATIDKQELINLIERWIKAVKTMDNAYFEDARKEFDLNSSTGFGVDGDENDRMEDFLQVRGNAFDNNPFVVSIQEHIKEKSSLFETVTLRINNF